MGGSPGEALADQAGSAASIAATSSTASGSVRGRKRPATAPEASIKNFSGFFSNEHALRTGETQQGAPAGRDPDGCTVV